MYVGKPNKDLKFNNRLKGLKKLLIEKIFKQDLEKANSLELNNWINDKLDDLINVSNDTQSIYYQLKEKCLLKKNNSYIAFSQFIIDVYFHSIEDYDFEIVYDKIKIIAPIMYPISENVTELYNKEQLLLNISYYTLLSNIKIERKSK